MKHKLLIFTLLCSVTFSWAQTGKTTEPPVLTYVERMPEPGFDIYVFLGSHIVYPPKAIEDDVQGKVMVSFIVNETGKLSDFKIIRSVSPECDAEAIRVLKEMPSWKPGMQSGKPVKVQFSLPILFKLE